MSIENLTIDPDDPEHGGIVNAYVYLRLHSRDTGAEFGPARTDRPEFVNRKPHCVSDFTRQGLTLEISNAGEVASDVVGIDYQVIFCTYSGHTATEGFTVDHAAEVQGTALEKLASSDFVPPKSLIFKRIEFPAFPYGGVANIYFRARVSTIWTTPVPKSQWDFRYDVALTEAHLRIL